MTKVRRNIVVVLKVETKLKNSSQVARANFGWALYQELPRGILVEIQQAEGSLIMA